ncbi:unnamed protein product [Musa acuminata subsp. malaccensis]|uniref:(wild Malaysian banana) hypothetical protein n=1 Tax=Musa acuminata subsp. malaccensis TaxID=214687 RepID=A0A804L0Y3_MUSAM|nr:unnamed protein product [Musa acuminata subsp. malaccensis]
MFEICVYICLSLLRVKILSFGRLSPCSIETGNTVFSSHMPTRLSRVMSVGGLVTSATRSQNRVPCLGRDKRADSMTYYFGHIMSSHVGVVFWLNVKYFLPPSRERER